MMTRQDVKGFEIKTQQDIKDAWTHSEYELINEYLNRYSTIIRDFQWEIADGDLSGYWRQKIFLFHSEDKEYYWTSIMRTGDVISVLPLVEEDVDYLTEFLGMNSYCKMETNEKDL